jgi:hypothetical protein
MRGAIAVFLLAALGGCGGTSQATAPATDPATVPVLAEKAVPGLESTAEPVTLDDLEAEFGSGTSSAEPEISGFVAGRERVFQGQSPRFDRVVSRTLQFADADAASAYVQLLRDHAADVYGVGTNAKDLESKGRDGVLIDAASCACHRAEPTLSAAVASGPRVTYLEVNGGGANAASVQDLLAQAP